MTVFNTFRTKILDDLNAGIPGHALLALSGGRDSMCLLYLLAGASPPEGDGGGIGSVPQRQFALRAVHINHGIRHISECRRDEECVREQCRKLGIELDIQRAVPFEIQSWRKETGGMEAGARFFRYRIMHDMLSPGEVLLTAQHTDDLLEGMVLAFFSGTWSARAFTAADERIMRPYLRLNIGRTVIDRIIDEQHIPFVSDSSNSDVSYRRNFIRRVILPQITGQFGSARKRILKLAREQQHIQDALDFCAPQSPWERYYLLGRQSLSCRFEELQRIPAYFQVVHTRCAMAFFLAAPSASISAMGMVERIPSQFILDTIARLSGKKRCRVEGHDCIFIREGDRIYLFPLLAFSRKKGYHKMVRVNENCFVYPFLDVKVKIRLGGDYCPQRMLFLHSWSTEKQCMITCSAALRETKELVPHWLRQAISTIEDGQKVYGFLYPDLIRGSWNFVAADTAIEKSLSVEQVF